MPFLFHISVFLTLTLSVHSCPDPTSILPCKCSNEKRAGRVDSFDIVTCNEIKEIDDLSRVTNNLRNRFIDRFVIVNSEIGFLPNTLFNGNTIKQIFIRYTPLANFSVDDQSAFTGVENSLEQLILRKCELNSEMPFELFGYLTKLRQLDIGGNNIEIVMDTWFNSLTKLEVLILKQNQIRFIQEYAFEELKNLVLLDLSENRLLYLQRSMFPKPFRHLTFLYLSYNQIAAFPGDIFTEMSSLQRLYLDYNHINVIHANSWIPIWNTIKFLDFVGNNVTCDCSLRWITERNSPPSFYGNCGSPKSLEGRRLSDLSRWDISEAPEMIEQHRCKYID